jgi:hypothetical protein
MAIWPVASCAATSKVQLHQTGLTGQRRVSSRHDGPFSNRACPPQESYVRMRRQTRENLHVITVSCGTASGRDIRRDLPPAAGHLGDVRMGHDKRQATKATPPVLRRLQACAVDLVLTIGRPIAGSRRAGSLRLHARRLGPASEGRRGQMFDPGNPWKIRRRSEASALTRRLVSLELQWSCKRQCGPSGRGPHSPTGPRAVRWWRWADSDGERWS